MYVEKFYLNKYSLLLPRAHYTVCIVHSNIIRLFYIAEEKITHHHELPINIRVFLTKVLIFHFSFDTNISRKIWIIHLIKRCSSLRKMFLNLNLSIICVAVDPIGCQLYNVAYTRVECEQKEYRFPASIDNVLKCVKCQKININCKHCLIFATIKLCNAW